MGYRLGNDLIRAGCDPDTLLGIRYLIVLRDILGTLVLNDIMLPWNDRQLLLSVVTNEGPIIPHGGLLFIREVDNLLYPIEVCG